jgi:hypothetical protein
VRFASRTGGRVRYFKRIGTEKVRLELPRTHPEPPERQLARQLGHQRLEREGDVTG